ncbi:MAG: CapA family protein [Candidatus Bathyarchaeia archaeon]|jgi:poly-gamma-glutamate synthesis protein (capsule biosynthesis protein)
MISPKKPDDQKIRLFLCGDVMTGRGIDQVLPYPSNPSLHEPYVKDAREYVRFAEKTSGAILCPVDFDYVWGDALEELERAAPDVRVANLETSITQRSHPWVGKSVTYRMNPKNALCLLRAHIDCVALANNHVLDYGYSGLSETLQSLQKIEVQYAGAGKNVEEARRPAVLSVPEKGRVLFFAYCTLDGGVPKDWAATENRPGVNLLQDYSKQTVKRIHNQVKRFKKRGDLVVFSVHYGQNWGYSIEADPTTFFHELIDDAGVDLVYGHSSHHVKGIEVYGGKLILYGCGDFLNDYAGIGGYEKFRGDISLMYFSDADAGTGNLVSLRMVPMLTKSFQKRCPQTNDVAWLESVLNREGEKMGTRVNLTEEGSFSLQWKL